jgi:hypothetical protein
MRRSVGLVLVLILVTFGSACTRDPNVPDDKDFQRILQRDITEYVTDEGDKDISVTVEMLRDRPTQFGVALPKFYVWIVKRDGNGAVLEEAAARIAAVEKTHFDVVQYYSRERILKEPDLMQKVFPDDVYKKILDRINNGQ